MLRRLFFWQYGRRIAAHKITTRGEYARVVDGLAAATPLVGGLTMKLTHRLWLFDDV